MTEEKRICHLSFGNHLKGGNTKCAHKVRGGYDKVHSCFTSMSVTYIMSRTLMRLTHVQCTSIYEWYRKHVGLEHSLMMNRSNIEWAISRGGEHKAMSSLAHLSPYLPLLFTPSHKQQDGGTPKDTCTRGPRHTCTHVIAVGSRRAHTHACAHSTTSSQRGMNPGWSQAQRRFHLRRLWF